MIQYSQYSLLFFFFFFFFLRAAPVAYRGSQARGQIRSTAADLHHSHSNAGNVGSLTHWPRPDIEPTTSWFLVGFVSAVSQWELLCNFFTQLISTLVFRSFFRLVLVFPWEAICVCVCVYVCVCVCVYIYKHFLTFWPHTVFQAHLYFYCPTPGINCFSKLSFVGECCLEAEVLEFSSWRSG